ncbi:caspase family protein [Paraflavitalea speifideaquila]|uniref:caspase family protein n=1 Tax=Paraflavitalea speifideaquila TaxID=3076558 RepID=UPI0028E4234C|nr:caspase family protein [Paraflavitalea speifideiaquila]
MNWVGNYPHVNPLPVTVNDATVLYKLLTNPDRAGYPENQVKLLVNEAASRQGILDGLDWLIECTRQDPKATAIIYFSGHGGISGKRNTCWRLLILTGITGKQPYLRMSLPKDR